MEQLERKYDPLLRPNKKHTTGNKQKVLFGQVRYDSDNKPRYHGEFEKRDELVYKDLNSVLDHLAGNKVELKRLDPMEPLVIHDEIDEKIETRVSRNSPTSLTDSRIRFKYSGDLMRSKNESRHSRRKDESRGTNKTQAGPLDWIEHEREKREKQPVKGAPQDEEEISLSNKMARVSLQDEDLRETEDDLPKPEVISGLEYLKQIKRGQRTAYFQENYDNLKKLINTKDKLDSKGWFIDCF